MKRIRLKELRKSRNESQKDMAKRLFVSHGTICRWEKEVKQPSIDTVIGICNEYEVSFPELMPGVWQDILKVVKTSELEAVIKERTDGVDE